MRIGVLTAMSVEYKQVANMLTDVEIVEFGPYEFLKGFVGDNEDNEVVLMQCGIGKANAAAAASVMITQMDPHCIISTGVAGGIDPILRLMDVVVGTETCYHDVFCGAEIDPGQVQGMPVYFEADDDLVQSAMDLDTDVRLVPGRICTGDQFITDRERLDKIKEMHPDALAVDMESAAIAQVCNMWEMPFLSFRIISDTPGEETEEEHFKQYLNFWQVMAEKSFDVTRKFLIDAELN